MLQIINLLLLLIAIGELSILLRRRPRQTTTSDKVILDSCALIDGRISDLVRSGFMRSHLIIPRSVVAELQHLADHGDAYKRERARYGLDIAKQLQEESPRVSVSNEAINTDVPVDERLIALAKKYHALLYTTDFNLNKVAQIEGVRVLNVNEIAQYLRPHVLPGETAEVKIIDKGQDRQQGVGYLPDGTMVVVEHGSGHIGKTIKVEFTRMLQTQAGRMMFAESVAPHRPSRRHSRPNNS
jgi:uncharacterized protein YacL